MCLDQMREGKPELEHYVLCTHYTPGTLPGLVCCLESEVLSSKHMVQCFRHLQSHQKIGTGQVTCKSLRTGIGGIVAAYSHFCMVPRVPLSQRVLLSHLSGKPYDVPTPRSSTDHLLMLTSRVTFVRFFTSLSDRYIV